MNFWLWGGGWLDDGWMMVGYGWMVGWLDGWMKLLQIQLVDSGRALALTACRST